MTEAEHRKNARLVRRLAAILLVSAAMAAILAPRFLSFGAQFENAAPLAAPHPEIDWVNPLEKKSFRRLTEGELSRHNRAVAENSASRPLTVFDSRRAYAGAPPVIPHLVEDLDLGVEGRSCLACHAKGGWVPHLKAYTPPTPHPEKINCIQCHAAPAGDGTFRPTEWKEETADIARRSLPAKRWLEGAPPQIPHPLEMREDCLSCHSGVSSLREIRSSHPERSNCLQCHVTVQESEIFVRTERTESQELAAQPDANAGVKP